VTRVLLKLIASCHIFLVCYFLGCSAAPAMDQKPGAVAVWDLENLSPVEQTPTDLGELLSAQVTDTLSESAGFTVVERQRLLLVLQELNIGSSDIADASTRLRVGKIVGAKFMVFGSYFVMGGVMRLDLRMVEVETGKIVKAAERTVSGNDLSTWLNTAREAARDLF
jgi:curli biogenesis system outer membrane secretion channel CsgG